MKVEIWSDVMCPFCYIGKRKFEGALEQFKNTDNIEIVWKSFQLAPDMQTDPDKSIHQFLAEHKGLGLEQAKEMNEQVANYAAQAGLDFNFDQTVPANSFNAHRFAHFAKHHGLQDKAEEALFKAYFTDGKNIDDIEILVKLGQEIGLSPTETRSALESSLYANNVRHDINEARQLGVRGVPFFVFDRKVAVSGAQGSEVFLQALKKTFKEWRDQNPATDIEITGGNTCDVDGNCD